MNEIFYKIVLAINHEVYIQKKIDFNLNEDDIEDILR